MTYEAMVYNSRDKYAKFIRFVCFKKFRAVLFALILAPAVLAALFFALENFTAGIVGAIAVPLLPAAYCLFLSRGYRGKLKKNENLTKGSTFFQFTKDYAVFVNYAENKKNVLKTEYKDIYRIYSYMGTLYVYLTPAFCHYMPLLDLSAGDAEGLKALLSGKMGKNFKGK
jgi:hypothetical protein